MRENRIEKTVINSHVDIENQIIELDVVKKIDEMIVNHHKEIMNLKEKAVQDGLIKLGWTPPNSR